MRWLGELKILMNGGCGWRRGPEVTTQELLERKIEAGAHHPGKEHHSASDEKDDAAHECHHEVNVILVLSIFFPLLLLLLGENTLDPTVGILGILRREDSFNELLDLTADHADLEEVGILGSVLLVDLPGQVTEAITQDAKVLGRGEHQRAGIALGDLDVALENIVVAEAQLQRSDSHGLGDGTEVKYTLLPQASEVEETLVSVLQGIEDHIRVAVQSSLLELRLEEVFKIVHMLGPDLLGPEATFIIVVLSDVSDDVGLLQEETHRLLQMGAFEESRVGQLGLDEQAGETLTDQAGNVVAVLIIFLDRLDAGVRQLSLSAVVGHTVTHLGRDVLDDCLVGGLHLHELGDDTRELNQQLTVLLLLAVASEVPSLLSQEILEATEQGLLRLERNRGIILDGIQTAKDKVEDADGHEQLGMEFLNDSTEASASQVKELETILLRLSLIGGITLMRGVVPNFPVRETISDMILELSTWTNRQGLPLNDRPQLVRMETVVDGIANETHDGQMADGKCKEKKKKGGTGGRKRRKRKSPN